VPSPEVVVIGGTNADIKSRAATELRAGTSNPGTTRLEPGGVGRNIAEVLARLGVRTALMSAVGADPLGALVLAEARRAGIDVSGVEVVAGATTGTYHAVLDPHGDLAVAVSSMEVLSSVTPATVHAAEPAIREAAWLVLDANLAEPTLRAALALAARHRVRVALDPVSVAKAAVVARVLDAATPVALLTPNLDELAALTGVRPDPVDGTAVAHACAPLHARGVATAWVRLGAHGSLLAAPDGTVSRVPTAPLAGVADVTGAGDSALAGYVWCSVRRDADPRRAARAGTATAIAVLRAGGIAAALLSEPSIDAIGTTLPEQP
jgi:pseudouridine kinase